MLVNLALTAAGILLLKGAGLDLFEAVAQTLAAVSTGGFSTRNASLAAFGAPAAALAMLLSFLGSLSFAWYFGARYRGFKDTVFDPRFLAMLVLCLLGAIIVAVLSPALSTFQAATMAVSAQTTVGFATADVHAVAPAARLALIFSMLVGGQIGSTAGGIKILRLLLLLRLLQVALSRVSVAASARLPLRFAGRPLQMRHLEAAAAILTGYLVAIAVSWFLFLLYGYDALDSLFDIASAIGTVGLSTGVVSPHLEPGLRAVLCVDMLMGRLETIALVVLIFPGTWIGRRRRSQ
jgi:trk system potassium uptake protein TrkH